MDRRRQLGAALHRYRLAQGIRMEDFAPLLDLKTRVTVSAIEAGKPVKEWTYYAIDRYFGWPPSTTVDFLEGGGELPEMRPPAPAEFADDPTETAIWQIRELSEARRRQWIDQLRQARAKLREAQGDGDNGSNGPPLRAAGD